MATLNYDPTDVNAPEFTAENKTLFRLENRRSKRNSKPLQVSLSLLKT